MSRVRGKDTKPEWVVRRLVHGMGFRYRLHRADLPGKPDVVLASLRKIVLVHGCFWHRHRRCAGCTTPKTRTDFWTEKFRANVRRDRRVLKALRRDGWEVLVVWECETKRIDPLRERLRRFLSRA